MKSTKKCRDCDNKIPCSRVICDDCRDMVQKARRYRSRVKYKARKRRQKYNLDSGGRPLAQ